MGHRFAEARTSTMLMGGVTSSIQGLVAYKTDLIYMLDALNLRSATSVRLSAVITRLPTRRPVPAANPPCLT